MDFLNQAFAQFSALFRSMSPAARITSGLLLAVVVASLALLVNTGVGGPDAYLLSGRSFSPDELTKVEAALGAAGLSNYTVEGTKIRVPRGQQAAYMAALAENDALPRNFGDHYLWGLSSGNALESNQQRQERMKIAKQAELAQIISSIRGISRATVLYDMKPRSLARPEEVTASVSVQTDGPGGLDDARVRAIRHLVANAIAGLLPQRVSVLDVTTGRSYADAGPDGVGSAMDDPYLDRKRDYQELYEQKVLAALSYVPGLTVVVDVELDRELEHVQDTIKLDPKTVQLSAQEESMSSTSTAQGPAGRPGFQAQQPNAGAVLGNAAPNPPTNAEETSRSEGEFTTGHDRTHTKLTGLTPTKVALAIGIPSGYLEQVWTERNPPAAGQPAAAPDAAALARIRDEVTADIRKHLLPMVIAPPTVVDRESLITVTTFQQVAAPPIAEPSVMTSATIWLGEYWSTLGMLGLGLFALTMLRSLVRTAPAPTFSAETATESIAAIATGGATAGDAEPTQRGGEPAPKPARLARRREGGTSLREELVEIVKEDPAAAANILQSWITSAT